MASMYFIAIVLPEHLDRIVLSHKQWMFDNYQCRVGLKSPAHLTLVPPFWLDESLEDGVRSDIDTICRRFAPFTITTNNFSAFKPRTIFIATEENEVLKNVKKAADSVFGDGQRYKIRIDRRPFHPHITIATRDMHKKIFFEAWPHFEEMIFRETWTAEGISLLRHNQKNWDVVYTSQFSQV